MKKCITTTAFVLFSLSSLLSYGQPNQLTAATSTIVDQHDETYWLTLYHSVSMPLKKIAVCSRFGIRKDPITKKKSSHGGLDLTAHYDTVYAMFDGVVEHIGSESRSGNYVKLRHGVYTVSYCHLSRRFVRAGGIVKAGDAIAVSGNTGRTTGPHLHLTCYKGKQLVDPYKLLKYVQHVRSECASALGVVSVHAAPLSQQDFIKRYAPMAMRHQKRYGIPSSVTLAQMALESEWGTSALAIHGNNFFGIKCTRKWLMDGKPYSCHDDDHPDEKFCNYGSVEESMEHHSTVLTSEKYQKFCNYSPTDYRRWLRGLMRAGYATSKDYVSRCEKIITQYKLYEYDAKVL